MLDDAALLAIRDDVLHRHPTGTTSAVNMGSSYSAAETRFAMAMERYKRVARRPYPNFAEVLLIALALGYRRADDECAECGELLDAQGEDVQPVPTPAVEVRRP